MSYTSTTEPNIHQKYAKLRTETKVKNEDLRNAYQRQVNEQLKATVEKERQHFQAQVDAKIKWCNDYAAQCDRAVNEARQLEELWRKNFEIVEAENAALREELARLASGPDETKAARKHKETPKAKLLKKQAAVIARITKE